MRDAPRLCRTGSKSNNTFGTVSSESQTFQSVSMKKITAIVLCIVFLLFSAGSPANAECLQHDSSLDSMLEQSAFKALSHPRSGIIYEAQAPMNVSGVVVDAVRLRSGSLRNRGIMYNEFQIPPGIITQPYVKRLVLVYQNLGNWSTFYGQCRNLHGFRLVSPVLGLLAYNWSSSGVESLEFMATEIPLSIRFSNADLPAKVRTYCVFFRRNGTVSLDSGISQNVCTSSVDGHFSLAVEVSTVPATPPAIAPVFPASSSSSSVSGGAPSSSSDRHRPTNLPHVAATELPRNRGIPVSSVWKLGLGIFLGGLLLLGFLGVLVLCLLKHRRQVLIAKLESQTDRGEALQTALIGFSRAPAAAGIRTRPKLESEYTS